MKDYAFARPACASNNSIESVEQTGMLLRDYFAAKAMAALVARDPDETWGTNAVYANRAYKIADAMMEARKQP